MALSGGRLSALGFCESAEQLCNYPERLATKLSAYLPIEFRLAGFSCSFADRRVDGGGPGEPRPRCPLGDLRQWPSPRGGREQVKTSGLRLRAPAAQGLDLH